MFQTYYTLFVAFLLRLRCDERVRFSVDELAHLNKRSAVAEMGDRLATIH